MLLVEAHLAPLCPFYTDDARRESWAAETVRTFVRKHSEVWDAMWMAGMTQQSIARVVIDYALSRLA